MDNITDDKPSMKGPVPVMRRTDDSIIQKSTWQGTRSGDSHHKFPMFNIAETTYPDSDPRWGLTPDDPDWPKV